MANPKIPQGYQGTYATAADGSPVLVMVSRSDDITDYTEKKEHKPMANNKPEQMSMTDAPQPAQGQFTPYTTEQKREYAKQFSPAERRSYRQGQRNAYGHMGNIGKRNSIYISNNLKNDEAQPPAAPPTPATGRKRNSNNNK